MRRKVYNLFIGAALLPFFLLAGGPAGAQAAITQGEWAVYLSRGLGLEEKLPPGAGLDDYVSTLADPGYRRIEGENFQEASPSLERDDTSDFGLPSNRQWMRAGEKPGRLKYRLKIPVDREYTLRARVRGGRQFWTIDQQGSFMVSPVPRLEWIEGGDINLPAGEHELTVSIPPGGGLMSLNWSRAQLPRSRPRTDFTLSLP